MITQHVHINNTYIHTHNSNICPQRYRRIPEMDQNLHLLLGAKLHSTSLQLKGSGSVRRWAAEALASKVR